MRLGTSASSASSSTAPKIAFGLLRPRFTACFTQFQPLPGETTRVVMPVFLGCDGPMAVTCPAYSTRAGLDPWMLPGVANEPPQHPPRLRGRAGLARQPAAAAAPGGQPRGAG